MNFLWISVIAFILYIGMIVKRYGILPSISDSWYKLPKDQKCLFTAFLWVFSFPLMIIYQTPILFAAGAFICLVGVNPKFKEKMDEFTHSFTAYTGIGLGMLSLIVDFKMYVSVLLFGTLATLIWTMDNIENKTWWQEIAAITTILISLMFVK